MKTVSVDALAASIVKELEEYSDEIAEGIKRDCKEVARQCVEDIKAAAPVRKINGGEYRDGWGQTVAFESRGDIRIVVRNAKHYRLTHLLENGHAMKKGGRVKAYPHIGTAAQKAEKALSRKVQVTIRG